MRRWWLVLIAVGIAMLWWCIDYCVPRWGWMIDRAGLCILIGVGMAWLADRQIERTDT